jgi:cytochrome c biogenesis protein CcmG/thiol:disulfide interchange protein DsbE
MASRAFYLLALFAALWVDGGRALAAAVGETAPTFALSTAEGATVALEQLRGRVVYLDFWASWCGPCRRSFPWMNEIQQRYAGKGVTIVAINVDAKREDAERFLRQYPASFTVAYDAAGVTPRAYDVKAMPSSYLIDRNGKIARIEQGFLDEKRDALEDRIRSLVESR